jgi:hypothetical protein
MKEQIRISSNPANALEKASAGRGRIPMSVPRQKLQVPDLPGYHLHWMLGTAARLAQAQQAGYTFVGQDELDVTNFDLAGDAEDSGNTDLGTRVSVVAGGTSAESVEAVRLYLMKLPLELWEEDQKLIGDRNEQTAATLRGDVAIENGYIPESHRKQVAEIFKRKN